MKLTNGVFWTVSSIPGPEGTSFNLSVATDVGTTRIFRVVS